MSLPILAAASTHMGSNYMMWQHYLGLIACCLVLCFLLSKESKTLAIAIAYTAINTFLLVRGAYTYMAFVMCFVLTVTVYLMPYKSLKGCLKALPWWGLLNAVYICTRTLMGIEPVNDNLGQSGFIDYASLNGSFIATSAILFLNERRYILFLLLLTSLALCNSAMPWVVLMGGFLCLKLYQRQLAYMALVPVIAIAALLALSTAKSDQSYFSDAKRFQGYQVFMGEWVKHSNPLVGFGLGSFPALNKKIQHKTKFDVYDNKEVEVEGKKVMQYYMAEWPWLHSDWLQIMFELGIIGFILWVIVYGQTLIKLFTTQSYLGSQVWILLTTLGISGLFNFPLRYFLGAFLAAVGIALVSRKEFRDCL